jgi:hypothetical protein
MTLTKSIKDLVHSRVARDPDFAAARRLRLSVGFGKYGSTSRDRLFGSMVAANGAGAPLRGSTKMPRGPRSFTDPHWMGMWMARFDDKTYRRIR